MRHGVALSRPDVERSAPKGDVFHHYDRDSDCEKKLLSRVVHNFTLFDSKPMADWHGAGVVLVVRADCAL